MERREFLKNAIATGVAVGGAAVVGPLVTPSRATAAPLRPPGALAESEFLSRCTRCMQCIDACPNQAIMQLPGPLGMPGRSTPVIKPRRQACMLCNKVEGDYLKCTEVCPTGALTLIRKDLDDVREKFAIGVAELDTDLCYSYNNWSCGACYRACPLPGEAMTLGLWERPTVNSEGCIGCGLCERACIRYPQAIRVKASSKPEVMGLLG